MAELVKTSLCNISINVLYTSKSRNSFCWRYFGHLVTITEGNKKKILNPDYVYCSECLNTAKGESEDITFGSIKIKKYNKTVSTGNLTRHLRDDHHLQDDPEHQVRDKHVYVTKAKYNIKELLAKARRTKTSSATSAAAVTARKDKMLLASDLALWYCKSLLPFDSVLDEGMVDFLKKYNIILNNEDVPFQHTVSGSALTDVYESMLMKVKETISTDAAQNFAMSFDLWTNRDRRLYYITYTLHYLNPDFVLKTWTLCTNIVTGETIGEKIKDAIEDIRKSFALEGKKIMAVTDVRSNVKRVFATHHLCIGHGLHNLITVDGINSEPEIKAVVQKCQSIVTTVRYYISELRNESGKVLQQIDFLDKVDEMVEILEIDQNEPIPQIDLTDDANEQNENLSSIGNQIKAETPTRWHVILEMLETVVNTRNRFDINNILRKIKQEELKVTINEWSLLEDLVNFLKCFREAVEILKVQKTCTLNVVLVFRSEIIDLLNSVRDDESINIVTLKHNMMENLNKRLPVTKPIVAAALLDTRFLSLKEIDIFLERHNVTRTSFLFTYIKEKGIVIDNEMSESLAENVDSTISNSNKTDTLLQKLSKKHSISPNPGTQDDPIRQECCRYIAAADPSEPKDGNLLSFWNNKKETFPYLAALAKTLLCVPATSIPIERMFSTAGLSSSAKRSRLNPNKVDKVLFIHENYKLCSTDEKL